MSLRLFSRFPLSLHAQALNRLLKAKTELDVRQTLATREKKLPSAYQIRTFLDAFEVDELVQEEETIQALLPMVLDEPKNGDLLLRLASVRPVIDLAFVLNGASGAKQRLHDLLTRRTCSARPFSLKATLNKHPFTTAKRLTRSKVGELCCGEAPALRTRSTPVSGFSFSPLTAARAQSPTDMDLTDKARRHRMFVACTMHALFQLLRGDPKIALEQLQRAMKFERNDSSTFVRMGACYIEMTDVRILGVPGRMLSFFFLYSHKTKSATDSFARPVMHCTGSKRIESF